MAQTKGTHELRASLSVSIPPFETMRAHLPYLLIHDDMMDGRDEGITVLSREVKQPGSPRAAAWPD